jgi:metal-dependent amidase/aminoacylase/carboxypeptidase family protein
MVHTSKALACNKGSVGIISKFVTYKGKAAHAGGAPQDGINALYAATLGLSAINAIRETFTEQDLVRVHPIMTSGGTVVNGIPDVATIESYVRAKTYEAMDKSNRRVNRALIGAALSMGAEIEIDDVPGYAPLNNDQNMVDIAVKAAAVAYTDMEIMVRDAYSTGSTDMGDLSLIFPSVHPYAPGAVGNSHGADYRIADADLACVKCAEWQVMMLYLLLSDGAKEAKRIKAEFTPTFKSKEEYFAYIERFTSKEDRISYTEKGAEILL